MTLEKILEILIHAVFASMHIVRQNQGGSDAEGKSDGTVVTPTDRQSEEAGKSILMGAGLDLDLEEGGAFRIDGGDLVIFYDPLDGSMPFRIGSITSTVIAAVYNRVRKKVVACVIGEPATGRIWWSSEGNGTWLSHNIHNYLAQISIQQFINEARRCKVWEGPIGRNTIVFADFYVGFKKAGFESIPDETWGRLFSLIYPQVSGINMYGSNGAHYALLANGGNGTAGVITSAFSGPWDVAPILAVIESGGSAIGYRLEREVSLRLKLVECDPLDPLTYQFALAANNQANLEVMCRLFKQAVNG